MGSTTSDRLLEEIESALSSGDENHAFVRIEQLANTGESSARFYAARAAYELVWADPRQVQETLDHTPEILSSKRSAQAFSQLAASALAAKAKRYAQVPFLGRRRARDCAERRQVLDLICT